MILEVWGSHSQKSRLAAIPILQEVKTEIF